MRRLVLALGCGMSVLSMSGCLFDFRQADPEMLAYSLEMPPLGQCAVREVEDGEDEKHAGGPVTVSMGPEMGSARCGSGAIPIPFLQIEEVDWGDLVAGDRVLFGYREHPESEVRVTYSAGGVNRARSPRPFIATDGELRIVDASEDEISVRLWFRGHHEAFSNRDDTEGSFGGAFRAIRPADRPPR